MLIGTLYVPVIDEQQIIQRDQQQVKHIQCLRRSRNSAVVPPGCLIHIRNQALGVGRAFQPRIGLAEIGIFRHQIRQFLVSQPIKAYPIRVI